MHRSERPSRASAGQLRRQLLLLVCGSAATRQILIQPWRAGAGGRIVVRCAPHAGRPASQQATNARIRPEQLFDSKRIWGVLCVAAAENRPLALPPLTAAYRSRIDDAFNMGQGYLHRLTCREIRTRSSSGLRCVSASFCKTRAFSPKALTVPVDGQAPRCPQLEPRTDPGSPMCQREN